MTLPLPSVMHKPLSHDCAKATPTIAVTTGGIFELPLGSKSFLKSCEPFHVAALAAQVPRDSDVAVELLHNGREVHVLGCPTAAGLDAAGMLWALWQMVSKHLQACLVRWQRYEDPLLEAPQQGHVQVPGQIAGGRQADSLVL